MPFEKGNKIGHRFKKGESGNPGGRPRSLALAVGEIPQDAQVRIYRVLHRAISMQSADEASKYLKDEGERFGEYGYILQIALKALNGNNGWQALNDILDRLFGKPKQTADLTVTEPSAQLEITIE